MIRSAGREPDDHETGYSATAAFLLGRRPFAAVALAIAVLMAADLLGHLDGLAAATGLSSDVAALLLLPPAFLLARLALAARGGNTGDSSDGGGWDFGDGGDSGSDGGGDGGD